jgi:predicted Zn finger-like uncharacterized protein
MLIVCPNCATSYDVDVASLRPNGRRVRCVRCRSVWQAELPHAERLVAAAAQLAPVRPMAEAVAEAAAESPPAWPPPEHFGSEGDTLSEEPADEAAATAADSPPSEASDSADADTDAAEPEAAVEVESPPIAPVDLDASAAPDQAAEQIEAVSIETPEDIESVAARRFARPVKRKGWSWPLSRLQSATLALLIVDAIVVGWRTDFVRFMPQTASFYASLGMPVNLRGLNFDDLATATEQHEGVPILVVEGNIVNETNRTADVPHIRFAVRNAARQEIYSWTAVPSRLMLPAGEAISFHTRLASPPPDAHDVMVRFVNRYDIMTGSR